MVALVLSSVAEILRLCLFKGWMHFICWTSINGLFIGKTKMHKTHSLPSKSKEGIINKYPLEKQASQGVLVVHLPVRETEETQV